MKEILDIVFGVGVWSIVSIYLIYALIINIRDRDLPFVALSSALLFLSALITLYGIKLFILQEKCNYLICL